MQAHSKSSTFLAKTARSPMLKAALAAHGAKHGINTDTERQGAAA